ncbi:uncharacterized protein LOC116761945 isoform X2 [Phocoena sinus]|uniref:uncharacterized protein LOC116761945 isoform X2 n=1 Tax=Phocoena sinus TaxID=42100 RepID=UPI0013C45103|nr:uncharacterized protein LOC116761945 isoform X2 [Phocoena sinus]
MCLVRGDAQPGSAQRPSLAFIVAAEEVGAPAAGSAKEAKDGPNESMRTEENSSGEEPFGAAGERDPDDWCAHSRALVLNMWPRAPVWLQALIHGTESEYHILLFDLGDPMKADLGSLGTVICMVGGEGFLLPRREISVCKQHWFDSHLHQENCLHPCSSRPESSHHARGHPGPVLLPPPSGSQKLKDTLLEFAWAVFGEKPCPLCVWHRVCACVRVCVCVCVCV